MKKIILTSVECIIRPIEQADRDASWMLPKVKTLFDKRVARQARGECEYIGSFVGGRAFAHVVLDLKDRKDIHSYTEGNRCAGVVDLHVIQALRGLGVGTGLIQYLEERCLDRGIEYLWISVNPNDNPRALGLYRRLGFSKIGDLHLGGTYDIIDDNGNKSLYEDWVIDMIKHLRE